MILNIIIPLIAEAGSISTNILDISSILVNTSISSHRSNISSGKKIDSHARKIPWHEEWMKMNLFPNDNLDTPWRIATINLETGRNKFAPLPKIDSIKDETLTP